MTQETLKKMYQLLLTEPNAETACFQLEAIAREALAQPPLPVQEPVGDEWTPCMKLPVVVHVRQQRPGESHVSTREGITPVKPDDLIMRGVSGEEYPIGRAIFEQTYSLDIAPSLPVQEPVTWDKPSDNFNAWWDSDRRRDTANPFTTDSFAYWAWEGWQAALAQRPWVGLTKQDMPSGEDPMFDHQYFIAGMVYAAKVLQEKNT